MIQFVKRPVLAFILLFNLVFAASQSYQTIFVDQVNEIIPYWEVDAQVNVDDLTVARTSKIELGLSIVAGFDFGDMNVQTPSSYESIKPAPLVDVESFTLSKEAMDKFVEPDGFKPGFKHPDKFYLDEELEVSPENAWTHLVAFSVKPDFPLDEYYSEFDAVERVYVPRQYCEMEGFKVELHEPGWESDNKEFFLAGEKRASFVGDECETDTDCLTMCKSSDPSKVFKGSCITRYFQGDESRYCAPGEVHAPCAEGKVCGLNEAGGAYCKEPEEQEGGEPAGAVEGETPTPRVFEVSFSVDNKPLFVPVFVYRKGSYSHSDKPFLSSRLVFSVPGDYGRLLNKDYVTAQLCLDPGSPDNDAVRDADPRVDTEYANKAVFGFVFALDDDPDTQFGKLLASRVPNYIHHQDGPMPFGTELIKRFLVLSDSYDHDAGELFLYYELSRPAPVKISVEPVYPDKSVLSDFELKRGTAADFHDSLSYSRFEAHFYDDACPENPYLKLYDFGGSQETISEAGGYLFDAGRLDDAENALCAVLKFDLSKYPYYSYGSLGHLNRGLPNGLFEFVLTAGDDEAEEEKKADYSFEQEFVPLQSHETNSFPAITQYLITEHATALYTADYDFADIDANEVEVEGRKYLAVAFKFRRRGADGEWPSEWNEKYSRLKAGVLLEAYNYLEEGDLIVFSETEDGRVLTLVRDSEPPKIGLEDGKEPGSPRGMPCANVGVADTILPKDGKVTEIELKDASSELLEKLRKQFNWGGTRPGTPVTPGAGAGPGPPPTTLEEAVQNVIRQVVQNVIRQVIANPWQAIWQAITGSGTGELEERLRPAVPPEEPAFDIEDSPRTFVVPESIPLSPESPYLVKALDSIPTYDVNENEFCESGSVCVLARVNDRLQPEYENAYLTCVEPESVTGTNPCNLVRIPQVIFDNENWGITECLGENKQCREDYGMYASDGAYRCGPQWINLYRLAESCGITPVYEAVKEGTKIEGAQPEYRVLMPGDKTPEETLLEPEKEALARLTEIAEGKEAGVPTTFVIETGPDAEKEIVVVPRDIAAGASEQGLGTSASEGEPKLLELVELVARTQPPKSPVSQGFCPPEPLFEGEADRLPAVAAIHEEAREGLTEAVKNPTPVQYDDEPAKIAEALGVSEDELAKVNVMTKEGKSVTVGADKVTKLEQLLKAFKELPKPQMIQEVLDEGVIAYYQEKPGPDWKTVELVAEKQLEAERVREEEAEKERAEAERLAEEKRIAEQSDRDARLYALQHPVGTVTFQYALASESLGGYIIDFQKEILLLLADVDGNSQIDEGEPTITVSKLRVRTGLGGVASAPTTNRGFAELGKADTYEQFKGSVESKSGVQGLLLSDVTEEKKQELLLKTFKDVYVCYDFGDLIGWRAVKLVYEEEGEPQ